MAEVTRAASEPRRATEVRAEKTGRGPMLVLVEILCLRSSLPAPYGYLKVALVCRV